MINDSKHFSVNCDCDRPSSLSTKIPTQLNFPYKGRIQGKVRQGQSK